MPALERSCSRCGERLAAGAHGLCDRCVLERAIAERADQGLPPTVQDPGLLRAIATPAAHALTASSAPAAATAPPGPAARTRKTAAAKAALRGEPAGGTQPAA